MKKMNFCSCFLKMNLTKSASVNPRIPRNIFSRVYRVYNQKYSKKFWNRKSVYVNSSKRNVTWAYPKVNKVSQRHYFLENVDMKKMNFCSCILKMNLRKSATVNSRILKIIFSRVYFSYILSNLIKLLHAETRFGGFIFLN